MSRTATLGISRPGIHLAGGHTSWMARRAEGFQQVSGIAQYNFFIKHDLRKWDLRRCICITVKRHDFKESTRIEVRRESLRTRTRDRECAAVEQHFVLLKFLLRAGSDLRAEIIKTVLGGRGHETVRVGKDQEVRYCRQR